MPGQKPEQSSVFLGTLSSPGPFPGGLEEFLRLQALREEEEEKARELALARLRKHEEREREQREREAQARAEREAEMDELRRLQLERERHEAAQRRASATPRSNDPPGLRKHPGPEERFHDLDVIARAIGAKVTRKETFEEAMAASGLNQKDVARVERMYLLDLFKRNGNTLVPDPVRVRQRDGRIALRVLSDDGLEWLDPLGVRSAS